jgi:serine protease Do
LRCSLIKNKHYLGLTIALLLVVLVLTAGCMNTPLPGMATPIAAEVVFPDFSEIVDKVNPSVVAISTEGVSYDVFNKAEYSSGSGSGWVLEENGTIVTNNHVIEGATSITVELFDHRSYRATILQADILTDTAVLKINAWRKLQPISIAGNSKLKVGDWVMIMGNPLGMGISAKQGIISRLGVTMSSSPDLTYYNLIETSAAVNPGNSGGPMVNMNGELIGMTSLKIDATGIEGMGYAMTIGDIMPVVRVLASGEPVIRTWLGISLVSIDNGLFVQYNLPVESGALVRGVTKDGPADLAGIKTGDIIVGMDNKKISGADDLNSTVGSCKVGQKVHLELWRENNKKKVDVTLAACPIPSPAK